LLLFLLFKDASCCFFIFIGIIWDFILKSSWYHFDLTVLLLLVRCLSRQLNLGLMMNLASWETPETFRLRIDYCSR
jgi:hypothetical protein